MAVNCTLWLTVGDAAAGETDIEVTGGFGGGGLVPGAEATVIGADADLVGSATLVAVTSPVAAVAGAV